MAAFRSPGEAQSQPIDDDALETERASFSRHPVLKWQNVGTFVELVMVDYTDKAPVKEGGQQKVRHLDDGSEKRVTQDVLTGLVIGGDALCSPVGDPTKLEVVSDQLVVSQFISGHNRWDPNRLEQHGQSWRDAKDVLGRGLNVGDLVRIDYVAFLDKASNGRPLQNGKKVLAFQCRAIGGTPQELAWLEAARKARRELKNAPQADHTQQSGFRPVAQPPVSQAAQAQPSAAPSRGLFD